MKSLALIFQVVIRFDPAYLQPKTRYTTIFDKIGQLFLVFRCQTHISFGVLKADLHGTILAYDCRMRFLLRALLASLKNRMRFPRYQIA